ncbi:MAG: ATP synthase F0 subunit B [Vulcanimicrobiota bacterium]
MDVVLKVLSSLDFDLTTFLCQGALFFVLHFSLNFLVYQPIMEIRNLRDKKISGSLAAAEDAAAEARRLKSDYEEKVRAARAEGQLALQKATDEAEAERKSRVEEARAEAARVLQAARDEANAALAEAEQTLEAQSTEVARAIAARLLTASLGSSEGQEIAARMGGAS